MLGLQKSISRKEAVKYFTNTLLSNWVLYLKHQIHYHKLFKRVKKGLLVN